MRKLVFSCSLIVFFFCLGTFLVWYGLVLGNNHQNKIVIDTFNKLFSNDNEISDNFIFPKLEINGRDYIGTISIATDNFALPIENKCSNSFFKVQPACRYGTDNFVIVGTNLKNSFLNYELYGIGDHISIINTLGSRFEYKIIDIVRGRIIDKILDNDLIIIVKDYYSLEYIGFKCKRY